ncbi:hypothetical protein ACSZM6_01535 [Aeromonas caviae]|uniref:hypothetical protein n=1 Tax=Aeromonas caviae TaxID=648 RepID=UPI003EC688DE
MLLVVTGNAVIFDSSSSTRVIDWIAFNLFPLSLVLFWFGIYFSDGDKRAQLFVIGHALLVFSAAPVLCLSVPILFWLIHVK